MLALRATGAGVINGPEVGGGAGTSPFSAWPECEGIREESQVLAVGAPGTAAAAAQEEEEEEEK